MCPMSRHADIQSLEDQLDAAERDARALVDNLDERSGTLRAAPDAWSVAECLDHLATANRIYLRAMQGAAGQAHAAGKLRRGPATPGLIGGWFVRLQEPPVKPRSRMKAPRTIRPRVSPPLADAFATFIASQHEVREFLRAHADLDLTHIRFQNPFIKVVHFSLATGLNVITAHERRHLWQAWRVRRAREAAGTREPSAT